MEKNDKLLMERDNLLAEIKEEFGLEFKIKNNRHFNYRVGCLTAYLGKLLLITSALSDELTPDEEEKTVDFHNQIDEKLKEIKKCMTTC